MSLPTNLQIVMKLAPCFVIPIYLPKIIDWVQYFVMPIYFAMLLYFVTAMYFVTPMYSPILIN